MSGRFFSARVFTLVFGVSHAVAVWGNYPLFRYYPLTHQFSTEDLADTALGPSIGPTMNWYGWIATAALVAIVVTAVIPKRIGDRLPAAVFWVLPLIMLAAAWYREREWFLTPA